MELFYHGLLLQSIILSSQRNGANEAHWLCLLLHCVNAFFVYQNPCYCDCVNNTYSVITMCDVACVYVGIPCVNPTNNCFIIHMYMSVCFRTCGVFFPYSFYVYFGFRTVHNPIDNLLDIIMHSIHWCTVGQKTISYPATSHSQLMGDGISYWVGLDL